MEYYIKGNGFLKAVKSETGLSISTILNNNLQPCNKEQFVSYVDNTEGLKGDYRGNAVYYYDWSMC